MHDSWKPLFNKYAFNMEKIYETATVYPPKEMVFKVFEMSVHDIKLVILGQDPYHNKGEAHGLSFSVPPFVKIPPSLKNIYKELQNEYPERNYQFNSGDLSKWARHNIFLLNAALTVEENKPSSHMHIWRNFTNDVILYINNNNTKCSFLLLGNFAHKFSRFISENRYVLGIHPSPLSAYRGFFNSGIFKKIETQINSPIDWSLD